MPYNGSMFRLRHNYENIFPNLVETVEDCDIDHSQNSLTRSIKMRVAEMHLHFNPKKIFKIKYHLSVLPSISEVNGTLMQNCETTSDLAIFDTVTVEDLIEFKWNKYAKFVHFIGFGCHLFYIVLFSVYIVQRFCYRQDISEKNELYVLMLLNLIYPLVYDMTQLK